MKKSLLKYLALSLLLLFSFGVVGCKKEPTNIENAIVKISQESYEYTGSEIAPSVEVVLNNTKLNAKSDYTLSYSSNIEIGIASIVVTGAGNYTGSITKNFTIIPANISGVIAQNVNTIYDGQAHSIIVEGLADGDTVTYKTGYYSSYESLNPTFTEVGEHTVYYKVTRRNHNPYEGSAFVNISPASITGISASGSTSSYNGQTRQITVTGLQTGDILTYSTSESGPFSEAHPEIKNVGTHKVYYKVSRENHTDYISYAEIVINAIQQTNITCESQNMLYDGQLKYAKINAPQGSTIYYKTNYFDEYSAEHPVVRDAGTYIIYFKVVTPNYIDYESSLQILITTATLSNISADDIEVDYDGMQHYIHVENALPISTIYYKLDEADTYTSTENPKFINAGDYTIYYKVVTPNYADYEGFATITINALSFTNITAENITCNYDGSNKTITVSGAPDGTTISYKTDPQDNYSVNQPTFVDAGEYTVYFRLVKHNYRTYESFATVTINKLTQTMVTAQNVVTNYTGSGKFISVDGYIDGTVYYRANANESYSLTNPIYTDAGTYTTYYKVVRKNYLDYESSATVTINPIAQTGVKVDGSIVDYDGREHTLTITGIGTGKVYYSLTSDGEYLSYIPTFTDVGHYTIYYKVVRKNYLDFYSNELLTINKVNQTNITCENVSENYTGSGYSILVKYEPGATIYYSLNNPDNFTTTKPYVVDTGKHTIYYKLVRKNYYDYTNSATVTINAIDQTGISAENVVCDYDGNAHTINVVGLHESATIKYFHASSNTYLDNKPEFTEAGTYVINYMVSRKNYNNYLASATVKINALKMQVNIPDNNVIYDGNSHSIDFSSVSANCIITIKNSSGEYLVGDNPSYSDYGKYLVEYKLVRENYVDYYGSAYIIISSGETQITFNPVATSIVYGHSLTYSHLQGGLAEVAGTFAWENPDIIPSVSDSNSTLYNVIFTPDSFMYKQIVLQITVPVTQATPTVNVDLSGIKLYSDMLLPDNIPFTSNTPGSILVSGDKTLTNGKEFSYTFIPNDSINYTNYEGTFTVSLVNTEISHIELNEYEDNTFTYDETIDKDTLSVSVYYANGDSRKLSSNDFDIVYNSGDKISVGDSFATISYKDKTARFSFIANKKQTQIEVEYSGATSSHLPLKITASDFTITSQNTPGNLVLVDSNVILNYGNNNIKYVFIPTDSEKYEIVNGSIDIELTYLPTISTFLLNGESKQITRDIQGFNITFDNQASTYSITINYDENKYLLSTTQSNAEQSKINSGENEFSYNSSFTYLYLFDLSDLNHSIQTIFIRVIETTHIQSVTYTAGGNSNIQAVYTIVNGDFEYTINSNLLIEHINVNVDENYTYEILNSDDSEFSLTNCVFKTYNLKVCVYDEDSILVESRPLTLEYFPTFESSLIELDYTYNQTEFSSTFVYLEKFGGLFTTIHPDTLSQEIRLSALYSDKTTFVIYSNDEKIGEVGYNLPYFDISGYLSYGSNTFIVEITNGTNSITCPMQIDCIKQNVNEFVTRIHTTINGSQIQFMEDKVISNVTSPISVRYTNEQVIDNFVLQLVNARHTYTAEFNGNIIEVNIYSGVNNILSFNIYCIFDGERNSDTRVLYTLNCFTSDSKSTTAESLQTITANIGDSFSYRISNSHARYTIDGDFTDNSVIFDRLGIFSLSITVYATDGITQETYTFEFNIVEASEVLSATLANGTNITLRANLITNNFGDFKLTKITESDNKLVINVEKHLPIDMLNELIDSNEILVNFACQDKFIVYKDNTETILQSLTDVSFSTIIENNYSEIVFGTLFNTIYNGKTTQVEINCKVIFKLADKILTLTSTGSSSTTKELYLLQNQVSGDFEDFEVEELTAYSTTLTNEYYSIIDGDEPSINVDITLHEDYSAIVSFNEIVAVDTSKPVNIVLINDGSANYAIINLVLKEDLEKYNSSLIDEFKAITIVLILQ